MSIRLETKRLLIRDVTETDLDGFLRYMRHEDYWRDVPIDPPTAEYVATMLTRRLKQQAASPRTHYFMAVVEKGSGELLGEAIFYIRSVHWKQAEIGWGVSFDHVGKGFATEIGLAMLQFAFDNLELHRVYAQCRVENLASRRIMAKLRMREEGILRDNVFARGEWWSSAQSSILSSEWDATAKVE
jgi:[ribosomal protein S5]-alanine N-acetyltransferase